MAKKSKADRASARDKRRKDREDRRTGDMAEIAMAYWGGDYWGGHIAQRVHDEGNTTMDVMGREVDVYVGGGLATALAMVFYPLKSSLLRGLVSGAAKSAVTSRRALAGFAERNAEIADEIAAAGGGG